MHENTPPSAASLEIYTRATLNGKLHTGTSIALTGNLNLMQSTRFNSNRMGQSHSSLQHNFRTTCQPPPLPLVKEIETSGRTTSFIQKQFVTSATNNGTTHVSPHPKEMLRPLYPRMPQPGCHIPPWHLRPTTHSIGDCVVEQRPYVMQYVSWTSLKYPKEPMEILIWVESSMEQPHPCRCTQR